MFGKKDRINQSESTVASGKNLTLEDARELTWTRVLEMTALQNKEFTVDDSSSCTLAAAQQVGSESPIKEFLLARSKYVIDSLKKKDPEILSPQPAKLKVWSVGFVLVFFAFVLGILTDELSTTGNKINLLSPPLLFLFLWNILIYIWLLISFVIRCFRKKKSGQMDPLRSMLSALLVKIQTIAGKKNPTLTKFYSLWLPQEEGYLKRSVAAIFHLSALFFGLGLIFSIGIRGWGTAYSAGWESTWLAESPNTVLAFLQFVYSLGPSSDGLFQNLNADMVRQMRFDITPGGVPATYWMIRLITSTVLIVIIPRFLLFIYNAFRAHLLNKNAPINLQTPYYQNIIRQWHGQSMTIRVLPFGKELNAEEKNGLEDLALTINQSGSKFIYEPAAHEDTELPQITGGKAEEIWIVFPMASTPEMEVHINFANQVKELCDKNGALCKVIVNSDAFVERFANTPKRIEEREKNWSAFLMTTGLPYAFANLTSLNASKVVEEFEKTSNQN